MTDAAGSVAPRTLALCDSGVQVPISGSPLESKSRSPRAGAVAAVFARQLWPEAPSADDDQREGNPRQWVRLLDQSAANSDNEVGKLRLNLAAAV